MQPTIKMGVQLKTINFMFTKNKIYVKIRKITCNKNFQQNVLFPLISLYLGRKNCFFNAILQAEQFFLTTGLHYVWKNNSIKQRYRYQ